MRPCTDPRICGVRNHKPGTICRAEESRKRREPVTSAADLGTPPPSASRSAARGGRPSYTEPAPSEGTLEAQEKEFQDKRWIMEQDPVAEHLDLDDHVLGNFGYLVRATEDFRTKNLIIREGDYVPLKFTPKTNQSIIMPPHKWGDQHNPTNTFRHVQGVEDHLPERVDRTREQRELRDELVQAYLDKSRPTNVDMQVNGHPVTFTINGEGEFRSTSDVAHISIRRHDGEIMHGWARTSGGRISSSFLGNSEGERYTDKLGPYQGHDPSSPFPSNIPSDYYEERGNRDTFDEEAYREGISSGHTLQDYNDTLGESMGVYMKMDLCLHYHKAEQQAREGNPSIPESDPSYLQQAMDELARFRIENDN